MTSRDAELRHASEGTPRRSRRPNVIVRLSFLIVLCGVPIVIIAAIYLLRGKHAFGGTPSGWFVCFGFAAVGILWVLIGSIGNWAYLLRVRKRGRADLVFHFTTNRMYRNGVLRLLKGRPAMLDSNWCAVSATSDGFVIWMGSRPKRLVGVRWSTVESIELDMVRYGRGHRAAARITCVDIYGSTTSFPLINANPDLIPLPSKAETTWVVGELNRLLAISKAPRVL
jgi:hypothetical protein